MRYGGIVGLCCAVAGRVAAATWTCPDQMMEPLQAHWLVAVGCTASGAYTTGGDAFGDGSPGATGAALCGSAHRVAHGVLVGTVTAPGGLPRYVATWSEGTRTLVLATAPQAGGPTASLVEVAAGTVLDGVRVRAVVVCQ